MKNVETAEKNAPTPTAPGQGAAVWDCPLEDASTAFVERWPIELLRSAREPGAVMSGSLSAARGFVNTQQQADETVTWV